MPSIKIDGLSPAQVQVAFTLAAGASISKAAVLTGAGRTTIYTWIKTVPRFAEIVRVATSDAAQIFRDKLHDQAVEALDTVASIMNDPQAPPSVRLRAALAILNRPTYPNRAWIAAPSLEMTAPLLDQCNPAETPAPDQNGTLRNSSEQKTQTPPSGPSAPPSAPTPNGTVRNNSEQKTQNSFPQPELQTPRGAPCPCGSGQKYKRCCGRAAPPFLFRSAA